MIFNDQNLRDQDLISFLSEQESVDVSWGDSFAKDFEAEMLHGDQVVGDRLPWEEFNDRLGFGPGQLTIHAGMNKHKKSMVTGQMAGWFALQGSRVGVMSFEMPIAKTMRRICCQMAGTKAPGPDWIKSWMAWNHERMCYYDKLDTTPADRVLAALLHMTRDLGCKHVFIDSLTKCGLPYGEGGPVTEFIDVLTDMAKATGVHIHLICHVRKPDREGDAYVPNRYDIRGAGQISDLAHNVIIHWANIRKNRLKERLQGREPTEEKDIEIMKKPCQLFVVDKFRYGSWDGPIGLTLHDSMQLHRGRLLRPNLQTERAAA